MIDDHQTLARTNALLVCLIEELRGLRADLVGRKSAKRPRTLCAGDIAMLNCLLPAIAAAIGAETFTVRSLCTQNALRKAIDATGKNALALGRLFRRATQTETPIAGLYIHRIAPSRDGAIFCINAKPRESHIASSIAQALRGESKQ